MNKQNATLNAPSPLPETSFPFGETLAKLAALQTSINAVVSKVNLNKQSLRDSLKNEYVAHYPQQCPNGYVTNEVWDKICDEVNKFTSRKINLVTIDNVTSTVSRYKYDAKLGNVKLQHTVTGLDTISLAKQRHGIFCVISDMEKTLRRLQVAPLPDTSKITTLEGKIATAKLHKAEIEAEIVRQQKLEKLSAQ
jgi:hypothetical protein